MDDVRSLVAASLGDSMELQEELIGGGMSRVFVALDRSLGRRVAVKVLAPELAVDLSGERFRREIMLAAQLQHPNIVPVLSSGTAGHLPYFIMPYVQGESLRARLERGPCSIREAVSITRDVARALAFAHGLDIVHRDIKPDNILLASGAATVADFGLAKAVAASRELRGVTPRAGSAITRAGTSIGTPAYMAPEQAAGDPKLDHRADLYSLGIVAYEMLVGRPPFQGGSPQQVLAAQLTERPRAIAASRYDVPLGLNDLIERLLEKEPSLRPKNAAEVVRQLDDASVISGQFTTLPNQRRSVIRRMLDRLGGRS